MKVLIITLCIFITFLNNANAGEMFNCIDLDGKEIVTDNPQEGMKCESRNDDIESSASKINDIKSSSWVSVADNIDNRRLYYNESKIKYLSKDIITVWTKMVYSEEGKRKIIYNFSQGKKNESKFRLDGTYNVDNDMKIYEINCKNKTIKLVNSFTYDENGSLILYHDHSPSNTYEYIIPETVFDNLRRKVCRKK
jgi:hypothetical protein